MRDYCWRYTPIRIDGNVDILTDTTAQSILAQNKQWAVECKKPDS